MRCGGCYSLQIDFALKMQPFTVSLQDIQPLVLVNVYTKFILHGVSVQNSSLKISAKVTSFGWPQKIDLSMRPGRSRAGSIMSGLLVAATKYTPACTVYKYMHIHVHYIVHCACTCMTLYKCTTQHTHTHTHTHTHSPHAHKITFQCLHSIQLCE